MRRHSTLLLLLALASLAAALLVPRAGAQTAGVPSQLLGAFRYPHDLAHGRAVVEAAIEPRILQLPGMFQGIARDRLRERTRIPRRVSIASSEGRVEVTYEGERTVVVGSSVPGTTTVRNEEGREVRVTQQLSGGWLEQVYEGPNGQMRELLSTEPDGATLHVDVTLSSERLGEPIRYRLDYLRER